MKFYSIFILLLYVYSPAQQNKLPIESSNIFLTRILELDTLSINSKKDKKVFAIINKAISNFDNNAPLSLEKYHYKSYDKFSVDTDSLLLDKYKEKYLNDKKEQIKSLKRNSFKNTLNKSKLILWERISTFNYSKRLGEKIIITDNKLSGTSVPINEMFVIQTNRNKITEILDENYEKLHQFKLLDSINIQGRNTYLIYYNYTALKKKQGYKGIIQIDAKTFGIRKIEYISLPDNKNFYSASYSFQFGKWFLENEHTRIKIYNIKLNRKKDIFPVYAYISSKFYDFKIPSQENAENFRGYAYKIENTDGSLIQLQRKSRLSLREEETYKQLDSLGEKYNFNGKTHFVNGLINGVFRFGKIDMDPMEIFNFNDYEGIRVGGAIKTNSRLNPYFSPDLKIAYGSKDKEYKYEIGIDLRMRLDINSTIRISVYDEVRPSGEFSRKLWSFKMRTMNFLNNMNNNRYHRFQGYSLSLKQDIANDISFLISLKRDREFSLFDFMDSGDFSHLNNFQSAVTLKYSPNTTNVMTSDGKSIVGQGYPEIYLNWEQGYQILGGNLSYGRFDFLYMNRVRSFMGTSNIKLYGGIISGRSTLWHLFTINGLASSEDKLNFSLTSFLGFATLQGGQYYNDRFGALYITHKILWYFKSFGRNTSSFDIVYRGSIGNLSHHQVYEYPIKKIDNYYQEIGIEWTNFLSSKFSLGIFYKIGHYNSSSFKNDFGFQFKLDFLRF